MNLTLIEFLEALEDAGYLPYSSKAAADRLQSILGGAELKTEEQIMAIMPGSTEGKKHLSSSDLSTTYVYVSVAQHKEDTYRVKVVGRCSDSSNREKLGDCGQFDVAVTCSENPPALSGSDDGVVAFNGPLVKALSAARRYAAAFTDTDTSED